MCKSELEKDIRCPLEYALTERGRSVVPILRNICQWAGLYHKEGYSGAFNPRQKISWIP